jgi:hypothetical protein
VTLKDGGAIFGELVVLFENFKFGFGIQRTGGFIKNEDLGFAQRGQLRFFAT